MIPPDAAAVRARLARVVDALPESVWRGGDEGRVLDDGCQRTPAAVLIGIIGHPREPTILLTQRTQHLRDHAGQISLPGGRVEAGDAHHVAAALREAQEEIGLDPARVEVLGELGSYDTVTGFRIAPVVGWIEPPVAFSPDPFEVAELFEVPLSFALDPLNHRRDQRLRNGVMRQFYVLPFEQRYIWGATAAILVDLARRLGPGRA